MSDGVAVGIDLGTTNSVVSYVGPDGQPQVFADPQGRTLHPSCVAFLPNGTKIVGYEAKKRRVIDPENTVFSAKRVLGRSFSSPATQEVVTQLPYNMTAGANDQPLVITRAGHIPVTDISALVLAYLRKVAESRLRKSVTECVITVPANFNEGQRQATRMAAERAGMAVLRILNEPTAAALAYGTGRTVHERIAVFDLGGGTFDVTILAVRGDLYEVIATGGDPFLGGDDMDHILTDVLVHQLLVQHRVDLNTDRTQRARVLSAAEAAKIGLSSQPVVQGRVPEVAWGPDGAIDLEYRLTRQDFNELIEPYVDRALSTTEVVLAEAGIQPRMIDEVILVGGTTMVPLIRQRVTDMFGKQPRTAHNPLEVVSIGAAIHAHNLSQIEEVPAGLLLDVTSHSLGIATVGEYTEFLIDKNTPIPAEGVRTFSTARDNQTSVRIRVCQGSEKRFDDNILLGELRLDDLRAARRGEVKVEVSFLMDSDGCLQVAARDLDTGTIRDAVINVVGVDV